MILKATACGRNCGGVSAKCWQCKHSCVCKYLCLNLCPHTYSCRDKHWNCEMTGFLKHCEDLEQICRKSWRCWKTSCDLFIEDLNLTGCHAPSTQSPTFVFLTLVIPKSTWRVIWNHGHKNTNVNIIRGMCHWNFKKIPRKGHWRVGMLIERQHKDCSHCEIRDARFRWKINTSTFRGGV